MDPKNAIKIRNVTKTFRIEVEDSNKKGTVFNRNPTKTVEHRVIDDISLDIRKGDVLGVLGRNGAGKSTFLSLIARIMEPDSGTIERAGKIATILELGMGFHPDMSGRENIYLKGELYGFTRSQIDERIDRIIEYSGIKEYIDNPVRTYSSGMSGRLAFAIMVNVDSDIMLVDEILSVGDTAFSVKAREHFKKMASAGKTVIFVSHQIDFIESMCNRVIWIENGKIYKDGPAKLICAEYRNRMNESPEIIMDLALAGVPDSQYKLAMMYRDGGIFEQNDELYEEWIGKAANQGHTRAQVEYANLLFGKGDQDDAIMFYNAAASKGDNEAKQKIALLRLPRASGIEELIEFYKTIATPDNCLNEYRCATLLLKSAWTNEERSEAFDMFVKAANDGSPDAMHQVAVMYRDGVGTPKDLKKMEEYFLKAYEMGFVASMVTLGDVYAQGKLLPKDDEKAFGCYLKAAELGDANSMYKVANMYREGTGVSVSKDSSDYWYGQYTKSNYFWHWMWAADYTRSMNDCTPTISEIYDNASDVNNPWAMGNSISHKIANGESVDDLMERMRFRAVNNNTDAIKRMGNFYYDGVGVKKDYAEAIKWYEKAASLGDSWSKNRLGEMYRDGKGTTIDIESSTKWFLEAAHQGNIGSIANLINIYVSGSTNDEGIFNEAFEMMNANALSGNLDAIKRMGNFYYDGVGVKKDYAEAIKWYEKAASLGDSWSKNRLGEMYRDGKGTTIDIEKSIHWFTA